MPAPNILDCLDEVISKEESDYREKHAFTYRHNPSSAMAESNDGKRVGACMRAMWYKAKQEPESNPRSCTSKFTAGFGNAIHTWFVDKLQKSKKISIVGEAPGRVEVDGLTKEVSFRVDGLVTHKGELGGLEIKTGQGWVIGQMSKRGPYDTPGFQKDILQVLSYFATNEAILWFSIVYVARDNGFACEYHVWKEDGKFFIKGISPFFPKKTEITDLSFRSIVENWKKLEKYVEEDEIPKRDYKVVFADDGRIVDSRIKRGLKYSSDKACKYCLWQKKCWTEPGWLEDSIKIDGLTKGVHATRIIEEKDVKGD